MTFAHLSAAPIAQAMLLRTYRADAVRLAITTDGLFFRYWLLTLVTLLQTNAAFAVLISAEMTNIRAATTRNVSVRLVFAASSAAQVL